MKDHVDTTELVGEELAAAIQRRWEVANEALSVVRRHYWTNAAFYHGHQWVDWDKYRQQVRTLARQEGRMRVTENRIRPNLNTLLAKHTQNLLRFDVLPAGTDDGVVAGARMAEDLLAHLSREQDWEALRYDALLSTYFGGTAAIAVDWNPAKGEIVRDPRTGQVIGRGEVELSVLPVTEFALDPQARTAADSRWWVRGIALSPHEVKRTYNLEDVPKADTQQVFSPLQRELLREMKGDLPGDELTLVLTHYERPDRLRGFEGRVSVVVGNQVVGGVDGWPFPFDRANVELTRETKVSGQWWGETLMNDARGPQTGLNHMETMIAEHAKKVGFARNQVPDISVGLTDQYTDQPGDVEVYDSEGPAPSWKSPPELPRWMQQKSRDFRDAIDDIMNVHAVSKGVNPIEGDASGVALALLAEKDDTPLHLVARDQQARWASVGSMVLQLYAAKPHSRMDGSVPTGRFSRSFEFDPERLAGQTTALVPIDAVTPVSRVAQRALALDLHERGLVKTAREFFRVANMPDQDRLIEAVDPDAAKAMEENEMFGLGRPSEAPEDFDDHPTHIAEHNRFRKSAAYRLLDPERRRDVDLHIAAHEALHRDELSDQETLGALDPLQALAAQAHQPPGSAVPLDSQQELAEASGEGMGGEAPDPAPPEGVPALNA